MCDECTKKYNPFFYLPLTGVCLICVVLLEDYHCLAVGCGRPPLSKHPPLDQLNTYHRKMAARPSRALAYIHLWFPDMPCPWLHAIMSPNVTKLFFQCLSLHALRCQRVHAALACSLLQPARLLCAPLRSCRSYNLPAASSTHTRRQRLTAPTPRPSARQLPTSCRCAA